VEHCTIFPLRQQYLLTIEVQDSKGRHLEYVAPSYLRPPSPKVKVPY
jgi:hypothetical protein